MFTQRLFGLGDADGFQVILLLLTGRAVDLRGSPMPVRLLVPSLLVASCTEHLRQQRPSPAGSALHRKHGVFTYVSTFLFFPFRVGCPERRTAPPRVSFHLV